MAKKDIVDFINIEMSRGSDRNTIITQLTKGGWAESDVQEAYDAIMSQNKPSFSTTSGRARSHGAVGKSISVIVVLIVLVAAGLYLYQRYYAAPTYTAEQYEAALSAKLEGVQDEYPGPSTFAGPAYVAYNSFWLNIVMPVIPNAVEGTSTYVDIYRIISKTGSDINDARSPFNQDIMFKEAALYEKEVPFPHLKGHRSIQLAEGAQMSDVKTIQGALVFTLPLKGGATLTRTYPFVLDISGGVNQTGTAVASTVAPANTTVTPAEKQAVIAAILNLKSIVASKDPVRIRKYLVQTADGVDGKKQIEAMTDKDIVQQMGSVADLYETITGTALKSAGTTFSKTGTNKIRVVVSIDGMPVTLILQNINGTWY